MYLPLLDLAGTTSRCTIPGVREVACTDASRLSPVSESYQHELSNDGEKDDLLDSYGIVSLLLESAGLPESFDLLEHLIDIRASLTFLQA